MARRKGELKLMIRFCIRIFSFVLFLNEYVNLDLLLNSAILVNTQFCVISAFRIFSVVVNTILKKQLYLRDYEILNILPLSQFNMLIIYIIKLQSTTTI